VSPLRPTAGDANAPFQNVTICLTNMITCDRERLYIWFLQFNFYNSCMIFIRRQVHHFSFSCLTQITTAMAQGHADRRTSGQNYNLLYNIYSSVVT